MAYNYSQKCKGYISRLKSENLDAYRQVLVGYKDLLECHRFYNYVEYYCPSVELVWRHFEYNGTDYSSDLGKVIGSEGYSTLCNLTEPLSAKRTGGGDVTDTFVPMNQVFNCGKQVKDYNQQETTNTLPVVCGGTIGIAPEKLDEYVALHGAAWPDVLKRISDSNIRNYVIYHCAELNYLLSHFEYVGAAARDADMAAIGADAKTREWWAVCEPCQTPLRWSGPPPSQGGRGGSPDAEWWTTNDVLCRGTFSAASYL